MTKLNNREFPDFKPELLFELEKNAKLTDAINPSNISANGLIVNHKLRQIFEGSIMKSHNFYEARVIYKSVSYDYFWLHFVKSDFQGLDLNRSIFYSTLMGVYEIEEVSFKNLEEAKQIMREKSCLIKPKKLVLDQEGAINLKEVFYLPYIREIVVSERIYNQMKDEKITGLEFKELL